MKIILLALAVAVLCVVLFVLGVFSPERSRRMQGKVDALSLKGEAKGEREAGKLGDLTSDALEKSRHAVDASARAGRKVNSRLTDGVQ